MTHARVERFAAILAIWHMADNAWQMARRPYRLEPGLPARPVVAPALSRSALQSAGRHRRPSSDGPAGSCIPQNYDQVGVHEVKNPRAWYYVQIDFDALTAHDPLIGSWGFGQKSTRLQSSRDTP